MVDLTKVLCLSIILLQNVPAAYAANCETTSTGLTPLTEMGDNLYHGKEGGLYLEGNTPSEEFQAAGILKAEQIRPLDHNGLRDDEEGKIVLLSVGMSLTSMEFEAFRDLSASDPLKNPHVSIIDGAVYGVGASAIANSDSDLYWMRVDLRLNRSGLTGEQVQVVWLKEVNGPRSGFPKDAENLEEDLKTIVQMLKVRYINLRIVYLSSRSYGGYDEIGLNFEPYAYETGFAVKWLIQAQITGDPQINFDASKGDVKAPLLRWGPYLWADGVSPRRDDGLRWECSDFIGDGVHPSSSGRAKVARLLLSFMQTDPTARIWYLSEDARKEILEPVVFASPFPTIRQTVLIVTAVGVIVVAIRLALRRRAEGEKYE